MSTLPETTIEEIKSRIDLGDLVASYGIPLKHVGSRLMACCPFHREKTPSFNIDIAKGLYHCFGCGESGDAIKFVMKQDGMTFFEAVKKLAGQCGIEIKEQEDPGAHKRKRLYALMAELAQFYHRCLGQMREAQIARDYLAGRDLNEAVQEEFTIGYAPIGAPVMLEWAKKNGFSGEEMEAAGVVKLPECAGDDGYHRFSGRLMFTIRDRAGRVVAFSGRQLVENKHSGKYVNSPETEIFKKSNVLFCLDRAAGNIAKSARREAIVCEGQIDCIRLHISGFPVAVAGQGTAFTEEHVRMLSRVADSALLVYDDDAAGRKAAIRSAGLLLAAGISVRVVRLPDGDDPDSFLRSKGAEAFKTLCDNAQSIVSFQIAVERDKETNPDSVDALARITRAVLATISQCPNAVLKAGMAGEAAKILGVPTMALNEELGKIRPAAPRPRNLAAANDDDAGPQCGDAQELEQSAERGGPGASGVPPPPEAEEDFMAFLMANENDRELDGMIGEYLPDDVFAHEFTRKFVASWRLQTGKGEDMDAGFPASLAPQEKVWFDHVMLDAGKTLASGLAKDGIMRGLVCALWLRHIERLRGAVNAVPRDAAEVAWSCHLANCIPPFRTVQWERAKKIISEFKQKGTR